MMTHLSIAVIIADMKKRQLILIVMIAVIIYFITHIITMIVVQEQVGSYVLMKTNEVVF